MRTAIALILVSLCVSANATDAIDRFLEQFVEDNRVPGAALAVTRDSKLVYAKGFGIADRESGTKVEPTSLFRIASISKPITSVAVLQLAQDDRIDLDDPIGKHLKEMARYRRHAKFDPRILKVTIRDLLQHSGGWDRRKSFDPMGLTGHLRVAKSLQIQPPVKQRDVMKFMFRERLQFDPGKRYAYSNFGYLILGTIIEDVTGERYEDYVKKRILAPLGIKTMQVGRMEKERRAKKEVAYYDRRNRMVTAPYGLHRGKEVPTVYGRPMQIMDAHGGWIASAVDLARFSVALDDPAESKLLTKRSIATMFARPSGSLGVDDEGKPKASYYALGWSVRPKSNGKANTWHTGSIQGTSTLLVRRHDGFNWALLFNTDSNPSGKSLTSLADGAMHRVIDSVKSWPTQDLFASFE